MRKYFTVIALLSLLACQGALAAKDCTAVQQKSGGAAYQKCLFDNQEETTKSLLTTYKNSVEKNKESVKTSYERRINEENYAWKDIDLRLQQEETDRKYRIDQLGSGKENAEQVQIEKNNLSRIQKIRSLTSTVHKNKTRRLQQRKDGEIADLDQSLATYELQLRQKDMPHL